MIEVSQAYRDAISAPVRTDRLRGNLVLPNGDSFTLAAADFMSGTLTIDDQCVSGEELQFGCVYLGQAAFSLKTTLDRYSLYGAVVTLFYEITLADGGWYTVPLGVYNVSEAERSGGVVALKAYDNAVLLDKTFDGDALQGTPWQMLGQLAQRCGLALGQTEAQLTALRNGGETFQLTTNDGCATYRDCVGAIAQLLAGFGTVDRSGALVIRQFAAAPCTALVPDARCKTTVADYHCRYDSLAVNTDSEKYTAETDPPGDGLQLTMDDVPLLNKGLAERNQALVQAMFDTLHAVEYVPATITMPGDPALECGDMVTLRRIDAAGNDANTIITHRVWKYHARQTLRGTGRNPRLAAANQKPSSAVRKLQSQTEQNKIIFYSFTNPRAIDLNDTAAPGILAKITFVTVAQTSAMFLAQLLLTAAPDAGTVTLSVQYYLNGFLVEGYNPQQTLAAGAHTLALFYPFAQLSAGSANTLELRATASGGHIRLAAGAVKATVTGQGMSGEAAWDGTFSMEDTLDTVSLPQQSGLATGTLTDTVQAGLVVVTPTGCTDTLLAVQWQAAVSLLTAMPTDEAGIEQTAAQTE